MSHRPGLVAKKLIVQGKKGKHLRTYWVKQDQAAPAKGAGGAVGGAGAAGAAGNPLNRLAEAKKTRQWTDEPPPGMPKETIHKYPVGKDGQVIDPVRRALHDKIAEEVLNKVKPVAPGQKKIAVMTMGAFAAGKSSSLDIDQNAFVVVDPDSIKDSLPEFVEATNPKRTYRYAATMVQEESSALGKVIKQRAVEQNKNILVDGSGSNAESYLKKLRQMQSEGYEVNVRMPDLQYEEGLIRMRSRAEVKGRMVPDEMMREAYTQIPRNVNKIMAEADTFKMVNNNVNPPVLVLEKKKDGTVVIHDKAYMEAFYARNPQNK